MGDIIKSKRKEKKDVPLSREEVITQAFQNLRRELGNLRLQKEEPEKIH